MGTRPPSNLDPNEEERVQGALLIQKAWVFAWLVHAELPTETVQDWPMQARGHAFQVQLSSFVRFLRPTITRVLCTSPTGRVHSSREGEPLLEAIALLPLAASHHWQVLSLPLERGNFPFYFSTTFFAKGPNLWREASEPQLVHHTLTGDHSFPSFPGLGPPAGFRLWVPQWDDDILSQWGKCLPNLPGTPFNGPKELMTAHPNGRHT